MELVVATDENASQAISIIEGFKFVCGPTKLCQSFKLLKTLLKKVFTVHQTPNLEEVQNYLRWKNVSLSQLGLLFFQSADCSVSQAKKNKNKPKINKAIIREVIKNKKTCKQLAREYGYSLQKVYSIRTRIAVLKT